MGLMHAQRDVVGMIHSGTRSTRSRTTSSESRSGRRQRSALWLYAWSRQDAAGSGMPRHNFSCGPGRE
jgi:hypothetical protein